MSFGGGGSVPEPVKPKRPPKKTADEIRTREKNEQDRLTAEKRTNAEQARAEQEARIEAQRLAQDERQRRQAGAKGKRGRGALLSGGWDGFDEEENLFAQRRRKT
jgi:hypothetical protein